jgi:DNA-binding transcriptional LysR family regulator
MELRHLRYFVAVAEELHFGRAAERLHMSQPPLSQQIQSLEEELDVQLFYRTKRWVKLTEAGQIFLPEARQTLAQAEQAIVAVQQLKSGERGHLTIGFVGSAIGEVLPALISHFRTQFRDVELHLRELTTAQQVRALHENRIQVGLLRPTIQSEQIIIHTLIREQIIVALPESHPLAAKEAIEIAALARETFILFPRQQGRGLYDQVISICQQAGFSPHIEQEATQMQTIIGLVAAELGIALIPDSACHLRSSGIAYRPLIPMTQATELAIAWKKDNSSSVLQNFIQLAAKHYAQADP